MIEAFHAYIGDPSKRTTCEFEVSFQDGSLLWLPWSEDIFRTVQYESFCRENKELYPILFTLAESKKRIKAIRDLPITDVKYGTTVFISFRNLCPYWYDGLELEDPYHITYVVALTYGEWTKKNSKRHISGDIPIFKQHYHSLDNYLVTFYGNIQEFKISMVLVDDQYLLTHPDLMPPSSVLNSFPKKP